MRLRVAGLAGLLAVGGLILPVVFAEETSPQEAPDGTASVPMEDQVLPPLSSPGEIEAAINNLNGPIDNAQLTQILTSISMITDTAEQGRLQQLLDERMQAIGEVPTTDQPLTGAGAVEAVPWSGKPRALTDEEVEARIQSLKLGGDATADDLRSRDDVVGAIIGMADPVRRERLLKALEDRERETNEIVTRPSEPPQNQH